MNIRPLDFEKLSKHKTNIYELINILSKRAKQIAVQRNLEMEEDLTHCDVNEVEMEESVMYNEKQLEIARKYENMPHPTLQAINELLDGKLYFRYPEKEK